MHLRTEESRKQTPDAVTLCFSGMHKTHFLLVFRLHLKKPVRVQTASRHIPSVTCDRTIAVPQARPKLDNVQFCKNSGLFNICSIIHSTEALDHREMGAKYARYSKFRIVTSVFTAAAHIS